MFFFLNRLLFISSLAIFRGYNNKKGCRPFVSPRGIYFARIPLEHLKLEVLCKFIQPQCLPLRLPLARFCWGGGKSRGRSDARGACSERPRPPTRRSSRSRSTTGPASSRQVFPLQLRSTQSKKHCHFPKSWRHNIADSYYLLNLLLRFLQRRFHGLDVHLAMRLSCCIALSAG